MPAFDGILVTCEMKNAHERRNIPVVAVTSHSSEFHDRALAAGCTKVVDKPVTL